MAKTATAPAAAPAYTMPVPRSGVVLWSFADRSGGVCTAIVTKVSKTSIDVMVFPNGTHLPQPKSGVRHASDPGLKSMTVPNPGGVWEFTEMERTVRDFAPNDY